jgi:xylan 1,4-beta-xylosidase
MNNMQASTQVFTKPWALCVGSDRLSTMLRGEYWERFRTLQEVMQVPYIRCHGLLCDELGVARRHEWEGRQILSFNFTYLDQIFDTMLQHRVRPFIEWGFMPEALASGGTTVFWWKGNITPPKAWEEWADLVTALTKHWIDRYGIEEVRRWPFEIWNEPNLDIFWQDADQAAYFRLYEVTVRAVKAIDQGIQVGGPAICGGQDHWIDEFLDFVKGRGLPLDFFSRHLYAGQSPTRVTPELFYQTLSQPHEPIQELREVRARIDRNGFAGLPLHITEFNTSYNPTCPVHDTPYNAAYLARLLSESGPYVDSLSYWTFCDIFEETDLGQSLFYGGFGMIARHGILKPTFHLFAFFNRMGETILHRDENCLATRRGDGTVAIIAWNPRQTADTAQDERPLTVSFPWTEGPALALRKRVNERWGNPWGLWRTMGRPKNPGKAVVDFLKIAAVPRVDSAVIAPSGGKLIIEMTLARNEITLVECSPFVDESGDYLGLDDALIDGYSGETGTKAALD